MDMKKRLLNSDFVYGVLALLFSIWWIIMSSKFPPGTSDGVPGCGVFPTLIASITSIMAIVLIVSSYLKPKIFMNLMELPKVNKIALLGTIAMLIISLFVWYYVHYIVSTIMLMTTLGILYKIDWKKSIVFGACFSVGTYYIFGKLLMVMLDLR